uniref:Uncharacterized protein n=1 Tax=Rhizophora mucronata TaxID=61149 RepID=A0A2P2IYK0_RHIMU
MDGNGTYTREQPYMYIYMEFLFSSYAICTVTSLVISAWERLLRSLPGHKSAAG